MLNIAILIGALVVLALAMSVLLPIIARVFAGTIGKEALSRQPDEIHLTRAIGQTWSNARAANALAEPFLALGFKDAGTHRVQEMPGVIVRLLAKSEESFYSAIYEHPRAGVWFDLVARYQDGSSSTWSTATPSGLKDRPGHAIMNLPGGSPQAVYERARSERPRGMLKPATADEAVADFESAYAESMAWRKSRGLSAAEVARAATRKAA